MFKLLLLATLVVLSLQQYCPITCNCVSSNSFDCAVCLQPYQRQFNTSSSNCDCIDGFMEMQPLQDSCRPANCAVYTTGGCVSCSTNWQLYSNTTLGVNVCVCKTNYEYVNSTCQCRSQNQPTMYYQSLTKHYCKICPSLCSCSQTGCNNCSESAHRSIFDEGGKNLCECTIPYAQINGECSIYPNCNIVTANGSQSLTCSASSLRYQASFFEWLCQSPYTDVNGVCTCASPLQMGLYIRNSTLETCACSSKLHPTVYFQFRDVCSACPVNCSCSDYGCVSCDNSTNRYAIGGGCSCVSPYIEHLGECICAEPYYLNVSNSSSYSNCACLFYQDSTGFHYDPLSGACMICPTGCSCNSSGCHSCSSTALRVVTETSYNGRLYYICSVCHSTAIYQDGQCTCPSYSQFDARKSTCVCYTGVSVYQNFTDPRRCIACPFNCTCSQVEGCFNCSFQENRLIIDNGGYKGCPCNTGFAEVKGRCACTLPYKINLSNSYSCDCMDPYQLENSSCQCKSINNPSSYYIDPLNVACFKCPPGCTCDIYGCSSCFPDTLRYVIQYQGLNICPCLQSASLVNGSCTYCPTNYMVVNGDCTYCQSCATCNILGCLSCNSDSTLNGTNCTCQNATFENINGVCSCGLSKYLNSGVCKTCPNNCHTCVMNTSRGSVVCTSCKQGVNRINAAENSCPCQTGHKELSPIDSICCPSKCKTCNSTGCLTCSSISNREFTNNDCVCKPTYVDQGNGMCGCPSGSTPYGGVCLKCPAHCGQCSYNTSSNTLYCTGCRQNTNRDVTSDVCKCLSGYVQATIQITYCIPMYCLTNDAVGSCTECIFSRVLSSNNQSCVCGVSLYDTGSNGLCKLCNTTLEGCLDCNSSQFCLICDTDNGYSLVSTTNGSFCKQRLNSNEFISSQSWQGLILQIRLTPTIANFTTPKSVTASLFTVYDTLPQSPADAVSINVSRFRRIGKDILQIFIANPDKHYESQLIQLKYIMISYTQMAPTRRMLKNITGIDITGSFYGVSEDLFIELPLIMSSSELNLGTTYSYILISAVTALFVLVSFVLYVFGFKHNQVSFFLQTLGLVAYSLDPSTYPLPGFLYPMKTAFYQFGERSTFVPIPDGYLEASKGNFSLLSIDSNIFRLADITLLVALLTAILILLLRVGYYLRKRSRLMRNQCLIRLTHKTRKGVYRFLQFLYKTCMYPLVFFAVVSLINWNAQIMMNSINFRSISLALSLFVVAVYPTVTIWQLLSETIAKVNRIENVSEFLTATLSAVIIAFTIGSDLFLLVIIIFVARAVVYIFSRKFLLRDFFKYEYLKAVTALLEIITICVIKSNSIGAIAFFAVVTVSVQISHEIVILVFTAKKARIDKINKQSIRSEMADQSDVHFIESRAEVGGDVAEKKENGEVSGEQDKYQQREEMPASSEDH